ncbi:hepatocyte growth factor-regulated tyrosine kinase substrate-like isoform X4 [Melanotaenia boesemani]|uniref:hepatocyte growth factor-regulated tyrosine kinase substrate-like isoform X3 n=1 Tax=Melanotaenia boesemani TaxID=1250792 RepID=UPI001C044947|nr:hepatocyte growth factor-regulated tyrosine kinase substrate-like isoform X3 [Melanotaenia boesemani]XP_041837736.1 hepatocyte growth factor-regulated tyrosine kinase substrate-like isoform X4 [Melanotaenia boesemani]
MKFLLFVAFVATISTVNGGKTARLLAAMNAGMLNGMIGGGLNPALMAGGGVGLIGQAPFAQFVPGVPALALRAPVPNVFPAAAVNAVSLTHILPFMGAPQMAQMNPPQQPQMLPFMGAPQMAQMNPPQQPQMLPFMGAPQMAQMNPPQQPQMGMAGGAVQQQPPVQPDPLRRFRRQTLKSENTLKTTVNTQIPAPESTTVPPCNEDNNHLNY